MKTKRNTIVFIGAGNVATVLAQGLKKKRKIIQVYSKSIASAKQLGLTLKCTYTNDLKKIAEADTYIIAVKDDAIEQVASALKLKGKIVINTSGSVAMDVLKKASSNYGVLYPLQTFSKDSVLKKGVPFCIEGSGKAALKELNLLVGDLSGKPYQLDSAQRAELHLAAVFVNNFANHLFDIANQMLEKEHIPFRVMMPLIEETINKLKTKTPAESQTGPAIRNDVKTIKKHEAMLKNSPVHLALYKLLTKSIQQTTAHAKKL